MSTLRYTLLGLAAWLGWASAINLPMMPKGLPLTESYFWPLATAVVALFYVASTVMDLLRGTGFLRFAALAMALLTGTLGLRLALLPLLPGLDPLALIGVREVLGLFTVFYGGFAAWLFHLSKRGLK